ncbi:MAG: four helix bundle protein [Bacteroidia bacterium]
MKTRNILLDKSYSFALRVIKCCKYLRKERREYVLSKQLLRSGTSIGANAHEANVAQSKKEFIAKLQISLKEAHETYYWLRLLVDAKYLSPKEGLSMQNDCLELIKILTSIIKSSRKNL